MREGDNFFGYESIGGLLYSPPIGSDINGISVTCKGSITRRPHLALNLKNLV